MTADSRAQERVFAFLTDPATHPQVHRIDTHAASVFLEGKRALKIKRAVRLPYLDYSTLAKRKAACEQEITINRRFAPQIYRRVVPITQDSEGSLSIDGDGAPVEFAIEMTRFDENRTIDHLAEAGPLASDLIARGRDASDATPEIAALQEKYHIGAVDWTPIDASGTPEQTLQLCHSAIAGLRRPG